MELLKYFSKTMIKSDRETLGNLQRLLQDLRLDYVLILTAILLSAQDGECQKPAPSPVAIMTVSQSTPVQQPMAKEYQIKAIFLYNFTQFVQWPQEAFREADSPLVIGILGKDPFGSYLDETVKGEVINNHPLEVERYNRVEDVKECHILFITQDGKEEIKRAIDNLKVQPVLTVSEVEGFTRMGGMIRFLNDDGRIKLRINVESAAEAELVISSKLLRLAEIISRKNN